MSELHDRVLGQAKAVREGAVGVEWSAEWPHEWATVIVELKAELETERKTAAYLDRTLAKHHEPTGWNCPVCS